MQSFIIVGYVTDDEILGGGGLFVPHPHPWAALEMPILNKVNVFKPSLTNYPYLKIFFLELLPEEYLELTRFVGWKLTAKSWLLRCREFPSMVLYWVLNKGSSNITLKFYSIGIKIKTGIFFIWSCIQNMVDIREYDFDLEDEYQSLPEMTFAL